jgi:hypothetical protein
MRPTAAAVGELFFCEKSFVTSPVAMRPTVVGVGEARMLPY